MQMNHIGLSPLHSIIDLTEENCRESVLLFKAYQIYPFGNFSCIKTMLCQSMIDNQCDFMPERQFITEIHDKALGSSGRQLGYDFHNLHIVSAFYNPNTSDKGYTSIRNKARHTFHRMSTASFPSPE